MFSPDQSISATASQGALLQQRRRRKPNDSSDTHAQAPPRKRTRITSAHYSRPGSDATSESAPNNNGGSGPLVNGNGSTHQYKDIPMREVGRVPPISVGRGMKADSSLVLVRHRLLIATTLAPLKTDPTPLY
jgi:hypothetical protein